MTDQQLATGRALAAAGVAATLAFVALGASVDTEAARAIDGAIRGWTLAHRSAPLSVAFLWITILGGITGMRVVAFAGAAYLGIRERPVAGLALLIVPFAAHLFFDVTKRVYARPRPGAAANAMDASYAFPSGHATISTAVCATLAFVLYREQLAGRRIATILALLVPALVGLSRVYLDVHWTTDVIGGWCAGLMLSALWIAAYLWLRVRTG